MIRRRDLLASVGVGWFAEQVLPDRPEVVGRIVGASHAVGHRLREGAALAADGPLRRAEVVVVGSGISGLSAAWRLNAAGVAPVEVLELEPFVGGTSSHGEDGVVAHPWGAHYLPVPEAGAAPVQRLLSEIGVLTGWDAAGRPLFDEMALCHAPEERLYFRGAWHGGLIPLEALSLSERDEIGRFRDRMLDLRAAKGSDGRDAFAIVAAHSSRDPRFLELDSLSMAAWLDREKFRDPFVRWFAAYATRDDFGGDLDQVSAWAGLHYFASRKLDTAQTEGSRYLVWPEGNGFLVKQLAAWLSAPVRTQALVMGLSRLRDGVELQVLDVARGVRERIAARAVIVAAPGFVTQRLAREVLRAPVVPRASSPWLVANLHVRRPVDPNHAWDSVIYDSPGLGYVDAGHQRTHLDERTVLTYFRAYGEADAAAVRAMLLSKGWAGHASDVLADLSQVHPELGEQLSRIDVMLWGHAMPRPRPGFLGARPFASEPLLDDRVAWAHVDQTGFALFEEACHHGVRAAEAICTQLDVDAGASWIS